MTRSLQGPAKWRGVRGAGGFQGPGEGPGEAQADPGGKVGQEGSWEEGEELGGEGRAGREGGSGVGPWENEGGGGGNGSDERLDLIYGGFGSGGWSC